MSTNFRGYLFKSVKTGQIFPKKYIQFDTPKQTPNQREEIKAYRDDNSRNLFRFTADGMKTVGSFKTPKHLHLEDKIKIQNFFTNGEESANHKERKILLEYWNDEENNYKQGWFYRPNLEFSINHITDTDIIYNEQQIDLIEY